MQAPAVIAVRNVVGTLRYGLPVGGDVSGVNVQLAGGPA